MPREGVAHRVLYVFAMKKTKQLTKKSLQLDAQTVRQLTAVELATVAGAAPTTTVIPSKIICP
jgi:hypothetical protein